jgi:hypothetical protein
MLGGFLIRASARSCHHGRSSLQYAVVEDVTPNEIANSLGVTGLEFRNWLRIQKAAGHALIARHEYRTRYRFTRAEADQLSAEFRSDAPPAGPTRVGVRPPTTAQADAFAGLSLSDDPWHRVTADWMGEETFTLADLLRPALRAVVVGINPSPTSGESPSSFWTFVRRNTVGFAARPCATRSAASRGSPSSSSTSASSASRFA